MAATPAKLERGFADPVFDAQHTFRTVMNAMARPGTVQPLDATCAPPQPLTPATGALLLTLADYETPVWLDATLARVAAVVDWLRFHTGSPIVADASEATFAVIADAGRLPALSTFAIGTLDYPDRSTTVILQVKTINDRSGPRLTGPGIATEARLDPTPLAATFWHDAKRNGALYPRGVDVVFAAPDRIAALPRSTAIELGDG